MDHPTTSETAAEILSIPADPRATASNWLILLGGLIASVAIGGLVSLVWRPVGGIYAGLLVAGVGAVLMGIGILRALERDAS